MKHNLWITKTLVAALLPLVAGCSTQWRTATSQLSADEVVALFEEMSEQSGAQGTLSAMASGDPSLFTIYHVQSDSTRPVDSVLALNDLGFIAGYEVGQPITESDIANVDVLFVDGVVPNDLGEPIRYFALMLKLGKFDSSTPQYVTFMSDGSATSYSFDNDYFSANLGGGAGGETLYLESTDLDSDFNETLAGAVKLRLAVGINGEIYDVGQVSTMSGFGGIQK